LSETAAGRPYHSLSSRICRLGTRSGLWPDMSVNNAQGYMKTNVYMPSYLYDFIEAVVAVAHFRCILGRPVRPPYHADRPLRILGLLRGRRQPVHGNRTGTHQEGLVLRVVKTLITNQSGAMLCASVNMSHFSHNALPTHAKIVAPPATYV
jgi:hypothetical protein